MATKKPYRRIVLIALMSVLFMFGLSACIKQESPTELSLDPGVTVNAGKTQVTTYKAELNDPYSYYDQFADLLLRGYVIAEREQGDPPMDFLHEVTTDGSIFHISTSAGIFWDTPDYSYINRVFEYAEGIYVSADDDKLFYAKDKDLPFKPRVQVEQDVVNQLAFYFDQKFTLGVAETFVLDHQSMGTRERDKEAKGLMRDYRTGEAVVKGSWNLQDDCYFIVLHISLDDVPMVTEDYFPTDYLVTRGCRVEVCYGAEGYRHVAVSPLYDIVPDQSDVAIFGPEEALKCVQQKCDSMIMPAEMAVQSVELRHMICHQYYSETKIRTVPVWRVELRMPDGANVAVFFFDALTGREIV
ncbi:MAG: hypothetical protein FWF88_10895 [Peptococcaceae bacterium]|nr:hypothetical protein [Peptococcaceae bacterium]